MLISPEGALGEELELAAGMAVAVMGVGDDDGDADEILLADDILHVLDRSMGENLVAASTLTALFLYLVL